MISNISIPVYGRSLSAGERCDMCGGRGGKRDTPVEDWQRTREGTRSIKHLG